MQYYPGDNLLTPLERRRGIPIGNLTSQFFANIYLDGLDHYVKEHLHCRAYIRYVDDITVFGDDKQKLWKISKAMAKYRQFLRSELDRPGHAKHADTYKLREKIFAGIVFHQISS